MTPTRRALLVSALVCASCNLLRPSAPVITPRSATVTSVGSAGLGLRVELTARNTNRVDLTIQSIDVRVTLAGRDLGMTHVPGTTRLPTATDVPLTLNVTAPLQDLPGIIFATALNENVPYHLDGTVRVGSSRANIDVPFQMDSTIPRSILTGAATNAIP